MRWVERRPPSSGQDEQVTIGASPPSPGLMKAVSVLQGYGLVIVTFLSFFPRLFHIQEYLVFSLLVLAVGATWKEGNAIWVRSPIDLPVFLFIGWILFTIPFATDPGYSFSEWRKLVAQVLVFYWALLVLRMCPSLVLPHALAANKARPWSLTISLIQGIVAAVLIGTCILCSYALVDFLVRGGTWRDRLVRAGAPYSDYNWLSTYMVIATPLLVAAALIFLDKWKRVTYWGGVSLAVLAQVFSYTRAGWLALVAQGIAAGFFTGRRRLLTGVMVGCLILAGVLVAASRVGYQQSTIDPWTLSGRLAVWKLGMGEVIEHPVVGVGYGNDTFMKLYAGYPETEKTAGLHNTFLMVTMGSGIPALAFILWALGAAVSSLIRGASHLADWWSYALRIATAIMIIGFVVRNLFDYMFTGSLAHLFWILAAIGLAHGVRGRPGLSA